MRVLTVYQVYARPLNWANKRVLEAENAHLLSILISVGPWLILREEGKKNRVHQRVNKAKASKA